MPERPKIFAIAAVLIIAAALSPQVVGAWFVNQANIGIAHVAFLPQDSPERVTDLDDAENDLTFASFFSSGDRRLLAHARILLARGDPAGAARTFDQTSPRLQSDPIARLTWAEAAQQSNQPMIAVSHWRAAGAYVYYSQQMHRAMDSHQWQAAEEDARVAVSIDPNNPDAHLVLGDALAHQKIDSPESLSELDQARELTRTPEVLSAIISRKGELLAAQGKAQQALDQFDQARTLAPLDARPRTDYASTLLKLQPDERDQAVALLSKVVSDSPWYTDAYVALASISEKGGDAEAAETWLDQGLVRNPNNPELLFALGQFYLRQQRMAEARVTLVQALGFETRADNLESIAAVLAGLPHP